MPSCPAVAPRRHRGDRPDWDALQPELLSGCSPGRWVGKTLLKEALQPLAVWWLPVPTPVAEQPRVMAGAGKGRLPGFQLPPPGGGSYRAHGPGNAGSVLSSRDQESPSRALLPNLGNTVATDENFSIQQGMSGIHAEVEELLL